MTYSDVTSIVAQQAVKTRTVKYFETLLTAASMSTTAQFLDITAITQGPSQNERVADTVFLERLDVSCIITTANADVFNTGRFVLFKWNESSALAIPTAADLFTNFANALTTSFFNFERRKTYSVIRDDYLNLTGVATSPTVTSQVTCRYSLPMSSARIDYDLAATTGVGKLYLCFLSDSSALPFPQLTVNFRVYFYDE